MNTIHIISHTHWDREWYRTFQQFRIRLVHLVDKVLEILESDPDFRYFMLDGQTIVLSDYLQIRPDREADLRKHIQSGRLTIGPWYILPDEFLVSPEATIRNLLEGEHTSRRFGPKMRIGYIPDPFGHIGQMPQILQGFGIQSACVQRGLSDEPCEFFWQSPDGTRVFMAYLRDGYGNAASLPTADPALFISEVRRLRDNLRPFSSGDHILLMLGTDHMEPPLDTAQAIKGAQGKLDGDLLLHSSLSDYITGIQSSLNIERLRVVQGELRDCKRSHLLPGVLSTRMWIKQRNRAAETLLERWAEPFSTFASFAVRDPSDSNLKKPEDLLHQAWRQLMENHPHDSICGCSIDQVHDEMKVRFDQVDQIGEEITRKSLEELAQSITTGALPAIIAFNPTACDRRDLLEATIEVESPFDLLDEQGNHIPYQTIGLGSQELIHADLKPAELQALCANVPDGQVMGMRIIDIKMERKGNIIDLKTVVSEKGEPNLHVWHEGITAIGKWINDPSIDHVHVVAISTDKTQIRFSADVPGLGWQVFSLRSRPQEAKTPVKINPLMRFLLPITNIPWIQTWLSRPKRVHPPCKIENETLQVTAEADGTLTIHNLVTGETYAGMNRFLDGGDCGDEYNTCPPKSDKLAAARLIQISTECSEVIQSLKIELVLDTPKALSPDRGSRLQENVPIHIVSTIRLIKGVARVDIHSVIDNRAKDHRLRVHFPTPYTTDKGNQDAHFEVAERSIGIPEFDETWVEEPRPEVPQRAFTAVTDGKTGLVIANRGLPEVEVLNNDHGKAEIAITLLRCVSWLSRDDLSTRKNHAGPALETPEAQMIGSWEFDYAIIPCGKRLLSAYHDAYAFGTPMRTMATDAHTGNLPGHGSFVKIEPLEFILSSIKKAEDGRGWILRGYSISEIDLDVTIHPWKSFAHAEKSNLAEESLEPLKVENKGEIKIQVQPHKIITIRFWD